MFCPNCGNRLENNALFCGECGTKIDFTPVSPTPEVIVPPPPVPVAAPTPAPMPMPEPVPVPPPVAVPPKMEPQKKPPKTKKPKEPKKPRQKASKFTKLLLGNLVVSAGLVFGGYQLISYYTAPEQVASRYLESICNNDFRTAYQCIFLSDSNYLSEENYIRANMSRQSPVSAVHSVKLVDSSSNDGFLKQVEVNYQKEEGSNLDVMTIDLVKEAKKHLFFFDTWKVSAETIMVNNYALYAPAGTTLSLDGTILSKSDSSNTSQTLENYDYYPMESIFTGHHDLKVSYPGMLDRYLTLDIDALDEDDYEVIQWFEPTDETVNSLMKTSKESLQSLLDSAVYGNSFESVSHLFSSNKYNKSEEKKQYDALVSSFWVRYIDILSVNLTTLTGSYKIVDHDGTLTAEVTLDYDYAVNLIDYRYEETGTGSASTTFTFTNENGSWALYSTNIEPLDYYY